MKKHVLILLTLASVLLTACGPNAGTTTIALQETSAQITEVTHETIYMNNCGGKGDATQTAIRSKAVSVDFGGTVGADIKVLAKAEVSAKYSQSNESGKTIELVAPPGTNMEFNIEWTENSWVGVVTSQETGEAGDYKVSVPISVALAGSRDLGNCPPTPGAIGSCPYQGTSDLQTLRNIKLAEQDAAISKNLDIIRTIFAEDAVIESISESKKWTNAVERYQENFSNSDVKYVTLTEFQIVKQEENRVWVAEKDTGSVVLADTQQQIDWTDSVAHLIFSKVNGCWLISYFAVGADTQTFP